MCFFGTITLFIGLCHVHIWRQPTQWWRIACDAGASGDMTSIPGSGTSPGEGNGHPLQYSCLENPTDRGVWWATVHGVQWVGHDWSDIAHSFFVSLTVTSTNYAYSRCLIKVCSIKWLLRPRLWNFLGSHSL